MNDASLDMWSYWCDKYGPVTALEDYYADLLARDKELQYAVLQIKNAQNAIKHIMRD